jgi:hypothetical protein
MSASAYKYAFVVSLVAFAIGYGAFIVTHSAVEILKTGVLLGLIVVSIGFAQKHQERQENGRADG